MGGCLKWGGLLINGGVMGRGEGRGVRSDDEHHVLLNGGKETHAKKYRQNKPKK